MAVRIGSDGLTWSANNTTMSSRRSIFPQETTWIFFQSNTPTGWTRDYNLNNSILRVVNDASLGGFSGGVYPFTSVFNNSGTTFTAATGNYVTGPRTLTAATIPSHNHTFNGQTIVEKNAVNPAGEYTEGNLARSSGLGIQSGAQTAQTGGGGSHTHDVTVGTTFPVALDLSVQYIDVFFASYDLGGSGPVPTKPRLTSTGVLFPDSTTLNSRYGIVPSGTVSIFYQASNPLGWSKKTDHNSKILRVVQTGGGTSGGSSSFTSVFTSYNQTGLTASLSGSVEGHQLAISEIPGHTHGTSGSDQRRISGGGQVPSGPGYASNSPETGSVGGDNEHTHPFSASLTYGYSFNISIRYIDVILCSFP